MAIKRFELSIGTRNAAFDDEDFGPEVARILRATASQVEELGAMDDPDVLGRPIFDVNGLAIGSWFLEEQA